MIQTIRKAGRQFFAGLAGLGAVAGAFATVTLLSFAALAQDAGEKVYGQPLPWQIGLQAGVTPMKEEIVQLHNVLLWIIFGVSILVMLLLLWVMIRYNKRANPEPQKFSHNITIEVIWTAVPTAIVVFILILSLPMISRIESVENPEVTIKVTGYQWYWGYSYPDQDNLEYLAYMIPDDQITGEQVRLLSTWDGIETPNFLVMPVDTNVQFLVTAADVLHNMAMPSFGIKMDAIPGRLNETWANVKRKGRYFGQCSELCGTGHAFMPIEIRVVSKENYARWAELAGEDIEAAMRFVDALPFSEGGTATNTALNSAPDSSATTASLVR